MGEVIIRVEYDMSEVENVTRTGPCMQYHAVISACVRENIQDGLSRKWDYRMVWNCNMDLPLKDFIWYKEITL